MESDSFYGERFSIRDSAKSLKKYGSTCNHVRNSTSNALIRHDVLKSDTLAGIALKYGCTVSPGSVTKQNICFIELFPDGTLEAIKSPLCVR